MSVRAAVTVALRLSWAVLIALMISEFVTDLPGPGWATTLLPAGVVFVLMTTANTLQTRAAAPRGEPRAPVETEVPVTGRWIALNSPADRVPSHGTHVYGQTYAIDLVAEPEQPEQPEQPEPEGGRGPGRPPFRALWPVVRRNRDFPAFGAPLLAAADATVVRASDGRRDHLSRTSLPALGYLLLVEGNVRSVLGARRVLGNHVVLDLGDGVHAVYAHLRRGSLLVRAGDTVRAGQPIGRCGNSGNSTEPHLHFHLMDGPDPDAARGIPFTWKGIGVPAGGEAFTPGGREASGRPGPQGPPSPPSPPSPPNPVRGGDRYGGRDEARDGVREARDGGRDVTAAG
ncbi:Glycyl-glycine endopeptidase ALE-1 precursor [Streptomyces sp. ADI96-02]|uniref:M23 family metallopeptidase n=1 Tax=Streptomyces sp. ADI96-02 TaxID=1522760 RepID=UPI000F55438E|nr:M23 family metallopeptidase [Streptomyces sp. ADI96-02]RPK61780.1 Glycyl-glycine endopeptidase ALE-1 precursor [Streptomyces sp. ADI96-02]